MTAGATGLSHMQFCLVGRPFARHQRVGSRLRMRRAPPETRVMPCIVYTVRETVRYRLCSTSPELPRFDDILRSRFRLGSPLVISNRAKKVARVMNCNSQQLNSFAQPHPPLTSDNIDNALSMLYLGGILPGGSCRQVVTYWQPTRSFLEFSRKLVRLHDLLTYCNALQCT